MKIKVTVWNEFRHEKRNKEIAEIYPDGIHGAIAGYLKNNADFEVKTATLDEPEQGLPDEVLNNTDVLFWWGHMAHNEVSDELVTRIQNRVLSGMGLICLHSAHMSKIFRRMTGTGCTLKWRETGDKCRVWVTDPAHPIAEGLGEYFEVEHDEMYGEPFDVPAPDELVFISWFTGGEVFRSGCCYKRGYGKVFYFQPGHETYPVYKNPQVLKALENAAKWAFTPKRRESISCPNTPAVETMK